MSLLSRRGFVRTLLGLLGIPAVASAAPVEAAAANVYGFQMLTQDGKQYFGVIRADSINAASGLLRRDFPATSSTQITLVQGVMRHWPVLKT